VPWSPKDEDAFTAANDRAAVASDRAQFDEAVQCTRGKDMMGRRVGSAVAKNRQQL
jgi:hypothetical protein